MEAPFDRLLYIYINKQTNKQTNKNKNGSQSHFPSQSSVLHSIGSNYKQWHAKYIQGHDCFYCSFFTKVKKLGCFLVLRKLLFVSFCVVVWVLFSVFSIFCITSLVSATPRNHQKLRAALYNKSGQSLYCLRMLSLYRMLPDVFHL